MRKPQGSKYMWQEGWRWLRECGYQGPDKPHIPSDADCDSEVKRARTAFLGQLSIAQAISRLADAQERIATAMEAKPKRRKKR